MSVIFFCFCFYDSFEALFSALKVGERPESGGSAAERPHIPRHVGRRDEKTMTM